jgi:hypothetical protein
MYHQFHTVFKQGRKGSLHAGSEIHRGGWERHGLDDVNVILARESLPTTEQSVPLVSSQVARTHAIGGTHNEDEEDCCSKALLGGGHDVEREHYHDEEFEAWKCRIMFSPPSCSA